MVTSAPLSVVVPGNLPVNDLKGWIEWAKKPLELLEEHVDRRVMALAFAIGDADFAPNLRSKPNGLDVSDSVHQAQSRDDGD